MSFVLFVPDEHPDRDLLGPLGEQLPEGRPAGAQVKRRLEGPAGEEHRLRCAGDLRLEARERLGAVDQHLDGVPFARGRLAGAPEAVAGRLERAQPAVPAQPAAVVPRDDPLDLFAEDGVQPVE